MSGQPSPDGAEDASSDDSSSSSPVLVAMATPVAALRPQPASLGEAINRVVRDPSLNEEGAARALHSRMLSTGKSPKSKKVPQYIYDIVRSIRQSALEENVNEEDLCQLLDKRGITPKRAETMLKFAAKDIQAEGRRDQEAIEYDLPRPDFNEFDRDEVVPEQAGTTRSGARFTMSTGGTVAPSIASVPQVVLRQGFNLNALSEEARVVLGRDSAGRVRFPLPSGIVTSWQQVHTWPGVGDSTLRALQQAGFWFDGMDLQQRERDRHERDDIMPRAVRPQVVGDAKETDDAHEVEKPSKMSQFLERFRCISLCGHREPPVTTPSSDAYVHTSAACSSRDSALAPHIAAVRVGSWNIEHFSEDKFSPRELQLVACVLLRLQCDVVAVQEMRSEAALRLLTKQLNLPIMEELVSHPGSMRRTTTSPHGYADTPDLGVGHWKYLITTNSMQRHNVREFGAWLYRADRVLLHPIPPGVFGTPRDRALAEVNHAEQSRFVRTPCYVAVTRVEGPTQGLLSWLVVSLHINFRQYLAAGTKEVVGGIVQGALAECRYLAHLFAQMRATALSQLQNVTGAKQMELAICGDFNMNSWTDDWKRDCLPPDQYVPLVTPAHFSSLHDVNLYDNVYVKAEVWQRLTRGAPTLVRTGPDATRDRPFLRTPPLYSGVSYFDRQYELSKKKAKHISDHRPVYADLPWYPFSPDAGSAHVSPSPAAAASVSSPPIAASSPGIAAAAPASSPAVVPGGVQFVATEPGASPRQWCLRSTPTSGYDAEGRPDSCGFNALGTTRERLRQELQEGLRPLAGQEDIADQAAVYVSRAILGDLLRAGPNESAILARLFGDKQGKNLGPFARDEFEAMMRLYHELIDLAEARNIALGDDPNADVAALKADYAQKESVLGQRIADSAAMRAAYIDHVCEEAPLAHNLALAWASVQRRALRIWQSSDQTPELLLHDGYAHLPDHPQGSLHLLFSPGHYDRLDRVDA